MASHGRGGYGSDASDSSQTPDLTDIPAETRQRLVPANDPVARNDDRQRVRAAGTAHCTARSRHSNAQCERAVGIRRSEGCVTQGLPDSILKRGANEMPTHIELSQLVSEIGIKLSKHFHDEPTAALAAGERSFGPIFPGKADLMQSIRVPCDQRGSKGALKIAKRNP